MSIREYSNLLVFEDLFESVPDYQEVKSLYGVIFTPNVPIVENDCRTKLGKFEELNYEMEGKVELATDEPLSNARITQLLSRDIYEVSVRATSHCVSEGGLCKKCYEASNPTLTPVKVGDRVTIQPSYTVATDLIEGRQRDNKWSVSIPRQYYDYAYVHSQGELLDPATYLITDTHFSIEEDLTELRNFVITFKQKDTRPFMYRLAESYSGAMLGMRSLPAPKLPLRVKLLTSLISENRLESLVEYTIKVETIPSDLKDYLTTIKDPLEKALFAIALNCLYSQVTS